MTARTQHTPGPWEIADGDPDGGIYIEHHDSEQGTFTLAHMHPAFSMMRTPDNFAADCRLIAAAPDMLAALRALADAVQEDGYPVDRVEPYFRAPLAAARAAIARAEGRDNP